MTVLIADDEDLARCTVRTLISRHHPDLSVLAEAADGDEAVALAKKLQPDLAILDIRMPGLDGLESAKIIRRISPDTAILMLTAYEDFSLIQQAVNSGVDGYLLKPIELESFAERLQAIKEKQKQKLQPETPEGDQTEAGKNAYPDLSWRLTRALDYINKHLHRDLPLEQVSMQVGISSQHLTRLFRNELASSFTKYLTEKRMHEACRLLEETPLGIAEIAYRCGYSDSNYFAKVFRKYRGMSPGDFRQTSEIKR